MPRNFPEKGEESLPPSLIQSFSGMVGDRINKWMKGESHLSFSVMQMIGQISSTMVTPVNRSVEGKALMQEIREGTQGLLGTEQLNRRSPESITEELIKSKVIPFNSL